MEQLATPTGYAISHPPLIHYVPSRSYQPDPARETMPSKVDESQEFKSPYDQASAHVQDCKNWRTGSSGRQLRYHEDYERPLIIKIPLKDWYKLSCDMNREEPDDAYPRLSYNASTSTLIIQCMPSPLHESISSPLAEQFGACKANLPRDFARGLRMVLARDYIGFDGRWEGSEKRPDLAFEKTNANGKFELKWILETGFTESYQDLQNDAQLWLEGYPQVSMVMLVKFMETPRYRCPIPSDVDPEQLEIPSRMLDVLPEDVTLEKEFGPAIYQELVWVQQISEAWMEIWVRDTDGKAIRRDNRKDLLQDAQIQIFLGDFLSLPPGSDGTITVDLEDFRYLLKERILALAVDRCRRAIKAYRKRMGVDEEYQS